MGKVIKRDEAIVLEKFRSLSAKRKKEALNFLDLLASGKKPKDWLEFDEWALHVAKQKGFDRLTEEDVARIVSDYRSSE